VPVLRLLDANFGTLELHAVVKAPLSYAAEQRRTGRGGVQDSIAASRKSLNDGVLDAAVRTRTARPPTSITRNTQPRYNICPTTNIDVVVATSKNRSSAFGENL
jgi:hypothetical protein